MSFYSMEDIFLHRIALINYFINKINNIIFHTTTLFSPKTEIRLELHYESHIL